MLKLYKTKKSKTGKGSVILNKYYKVVICPYIKPDEFVIFDIPDKYTPSSGIFNKDIGITDYEDREKCVIYKHKRQDFKKDSNYIKENIGYYLGVLNVALRDIMNNNRYTYNNIHAEINKIIVSNNIHLIELIISVEQEGCNRILYRNILVNKNTNIMSSDLIDSFEKVNLYKKDYKKKPVLYGLDVSYKNKNISDCLFLSTKRYPTMANEKFARYLSKCTFNDIERFEEWLSYGTIIGSRIMFLDTGKEYKLDSKRSNVGEIYDEIKKYLELNKKLNWADQLVNLLTPEETNKLDEILRGDKNDNIFNEKTKKSSKKRKDQHSF